MQALAEIFSSCSRFEMFGKAEVPEMPPVCPGSEESPDPTGVLVGVIVNELAGAFKVGCYGGLTALVKQSLQPTK